MVGCFIITLATLVFHIIMLDLSMRGLDQSVPYPVLALAFMLPTMLGQIVPIPGGVGVTEASMVGFLTTTEQLNTELVVAAVAIFRIVSIVFPAAVGALVYFLFWRGEKEVQDTSGKRQSMLEASRASNSDL